MSDRSSLVVLLIGLILGASLFTVVLYKTGVIDWSIDEAIVGEVELPEYARPISEFQIDFEGISDKPDFCFGCHDPDQTKSFHTPKKIVEIAESKGLRRRICVDCHGPDGNSAAEQMSSISMIKLQEDGTFRLGNIIPHSIHTEKMDLGAMACETCHLSSEGDLEIPVADAGQGQVLVCEKCHIPVNKGNYIAIHVEYGSKSCLTCHTGDVIGIHKEATSMLGSTSERTH